MGNLVSRTIYPWRNLDDKIINGVVESLNEIQTMVDGISADRDRCLDNYKDWKRGRLRTLSALKKCQDELDLIHVCSSTGRAAGNVASILGGAATIIGFGLSFSKDLKEVGNELMKYGSTVGVVGGATSIAASLAGKGFSALVLKEVKSALEEDTRLTKDLLPWFKRSEELDSLFQEVFDIRVGCGISDIFTAVKEISAICESGSKTLVDITDYLAITMKSNFSEESLRNLNNERLEKILLNASHKVKILLLGFCQSSRVQKAIQTLHATFMRNPDLFELPIVTNRIIRQLAGQGTALSSVISLTGGSSLIIGTQCIFPAISVVANVYALLSAVEDIKKGESKYSVIIKRTKGCLLKELETLESSPLLRRGNAKINVNQRLSFAPRKQQCLLAF